MRLFRLQTASANSERSSWMEVSHDKDNNELLLYVTIEEEEDDSIPFRLALGEIDDFISFLKETKEAIEVQNIEAKEDTP